MEQVSKSKRYNARYIVIGGSLLLITIILLFIFLKPPERSIAAYCSTLKTEKSRLVTLPGDLHESGVFNEAVADAGEFANSYAKLEPVAPDEILPDVQTLRGIYQKMDEDPTTAIAGSLTASSVDQKLKDWAATRCN